MFPPLNPRFNTGREVDDTVYLEGRTKRGDRFDNLTTEYGGNYAPRLRNERAGLYNPTDLKRPAGRAQSVYGRSKFLFKDVEDKMSIFGNTVSEKGLQKLSALLGDVEVPDVGDDLWLEERDRIIDAQRALGKSEKQIADYLRVNKPLNRDQNKVKKSDTSGSALPSKSRQLAAITTAINTGLTANLAGQTAITQAVIELLGKFGDKMDEIEIDNINKQLQVIKPGLSWKDPPIEKRFLTKADFKIDNPKLGFYLALILQTAGGSPPVAKISPGARRFLPATDVNTLATLIKHMASSTFTAYFDLENNYIATEAEVRDVAAPQGTFDPVLWAYLSGQSNVRTVIAQIEADEVAEIALAEAQKDADLRQSIADSNAEMARLRGRRTGFDENELNTKLAETRQARDDLLEEIRVLRVTPNVRQRDRKIRNKRTQINNVVQPVIDDIRNDITDMRADRRALERVRAANEAQILTIAADRINGIKARSATRKQQAVRNI